MDLGPIVTPALAGGPRGAVLTRREREIVALARAGVPNRAIADQLVLSIRSVENHMQRAYDKLGVRNRDELAALDWPAGLGG